MIISLDYCALTVLCFISAVHVASAQSPAPKTVTIPAADGTLLAATYFPAARRGPVVLLLHQCDDSRKVWTPLASRLAAAGISALAVDYRGYGESGGTPHEKLSLAELGVQQREQTPADVESVFAYVSKLTGIDTSRIAVAGGSCGATFATQVATHHAGVKALVLLAGDPDKAGRTFLAKRDAIPVFTAAAAGDAYGDYVTIMGWYTAISPNPQSRMAQYPDGGHAAVIFAKYPGLADTITQWLSVVLKTRSGTLPKTNGVPMAKGVQQALADIDRPGGAAKVAKQLTAARANNPGAQMFPEYFVNIIGYEHLAGNDAAGALEIMKLNVQAYPASPNAMDSLGDIYLVRGDKAAGLKAAHETIALLAKDTVDSQERKQVIRNAAEAKIKALTT